MGNAAGEGEMAVDEGSGEPTATPAGGSGAGGSGASGSGAGGAGAGGAGAGGSGTRGSGASGSGASGSSAGGSGASGSAADGPGSGGSVAGRLGLAVLLAAAVTAVLAIAARAHQPDYSASIFGQTALGALALKSWLATITLGLAGVQVLLALWLYRKLPF